MRGGSSNCLLLRVLLVLACLLAVVQGQDNTTNATAAPLPSSELCAQLQPSDVLIFVVESNGPVGTIVGFLALEDLLPGLELHLTDRPWNGSHFLETNLAGESDVKLIVGQAGINGLERFGYVNASFIETWADPENAGDLELLDLNHTQGDSLFLYCYLADGSIRHLVGFSNAGEWLEPGLTLEDYQESFSALPDQLAEVGSIALPHMDQYEYIGSNIGRKRQLQEFMTNASNWNGTDIPFIDVEVITVVVENTTTTIYGTNPGALENVLSTPPPAQQPTGPPQVEPSTSGGVATVRRSSLASWLIIGSSVSAWWLF